MWALVVGLSLPAAARVQAQTVGEADSPAASSAASRDWLKFLGGAGTGLGAHEAGHLLFAWVFEGEPSIKKVDFAGIPFFAVTHRPGLSPRRELVVSAAGFWSQHASSEWLLTRNPHLRESHAPFEKGLLAFNVLTSVGYSAAAFARYGPFERDTRAVGEALRVDERWVGAMVLVPAVLDAYRFFHPDSHWATWSSRAVKVGWMVLVF